MSFTENHHLVFVSYYESSNKIWGWFAPRDQQWRRSAHRSNVRAAHDIFAFWAVVGKTITVHRHRWRGNINQTKAKKLAGKYEEIDQLRLSQLWPSFFGDMDRHMLWLSLSDGLE